MCNDAVDKLPYRFHIDNERNVIEKIKEKNPEWTQNDGICSRCVDYYHVEIVREQRMLPEIGPYFPSTGDFVILPTGLRVNADPTHPDLTAYRNRIKKVIDVTKPEVSPTGSEIFDGAWHGTMTTRCMCR